MVVPQAGAAQRKRISTELGKAGGKPDPWSDFKGRCFWICAAPSTCLRAASWWDCACLTIRPRFGAFGAGRCGQEGGGGGGKGAWVEISFQAFARGTN